VIRDDRPGFAEVRAGQGKPGVPALQGGQTQAVNIPAQKAALASVMSARVEKRAAW